MKKNNESKFKVFFYRTSFLAACFATILGNVAFFSGCDDAPSDYDAIGYVSDDGEISEPEESRQFECPSCGGTERCGSCLSSSGMCFACYDSHVCTVCLPAGVRVEGRCPDCATLPGMSYISPGSCRACNGAGKHLNPFLGNYNLCTTCGGQGICRKCGGSGALMFTSTGYSLSRPGLY